MEAFNSVDLSVSPNSVQQESLCVTRAVDCSKHSVSDYFFLLLSLFNITEITLHVHLGQTALIVSTEIPPNRFSNKFGLALSQKTVVSKGRGKGTEIAERTDGLHQGLVFDKQGLF